MVSWCGLTYGLFFPHLDWLAPTIKNKLAVNQRSYRLWAGKVMKLLNGIS